jgi:hypothetical protein
MKRLRDIRRVVPLPPRTRGRERMERTVDNAFAAMRLGALVPGFVGDNEIAKMREHLDEIASIIDETVADDDKAGLLLATIGYAFDRIFGLGRIQGGNEPGRRLRERDAARELGARERGKQLTAKAAEWHKPVRPIWVGEARAAHRRRPEAPKSVSGASGKSDHRRAPR